MKTNLLCIFLLISVTTFTQETLPPEVVENINQRIESGIHPSIVVGIIDADGPRYFSYGYEKEDGDAVNEHTIYEIGSITKPFTATLLAHSVLNTDMTLDDPIADYLPKSARVSAHNGEEITLAHLSDHTSSLPRLPSNMDPKDPSNPYADYSVKDMYHFLSDYELPRDIGSEYEYSNLAQGLLGHILALDAGKSYEELLTQVITSPLGMHETKITFDKKMQENLALPHAQGQIVSNWDLPTLAGAGAIRSSVHDMLIFLGTNMGLKKSPLSEAMEMTHQVRHDKAAGGTMIGLAWHIRKTSDDQQVISHGGGTGGYRTFAGFIKDKNIGVVVMTNSGEDAGDIGRYLLDPDGNELTIAKPHIARELRKMLDEKGAEAAIVHFYELKESSADKYDFSENEINNLGYYYLNQKNIEAALALFKINADEYPKSSNVYDSYGEALMVDGQNELAIENYEKSLELNPGNTNAVEMLAKMGVEKEVKEIAVSQDILSSYVGKYQLAPGFLIEVTTENGQLFGQATGQGQFEMFAKNNTEFYLKITAASCTFHVEDGKTTGMTWNQGGQEVLADKVE